jgi:acyl-CoA synthetase (AMP-forming)/AMP-acid ligase II/enoyl-CoA hydratase/carnithine racemase
VAVKRTRFADIVNDDDRRQHYLRAGYWDASTMGSASAAHARETPNRPAIIDSDGRRTTSYGDLFRDATALANWFRAAGVDRGDVVSVQLPNQYETVVVAVAVQLVGAVLNPLLPNYRMHELAHVFTTARPKIFFSPVVYRDFDHVALAAQVAAATGVHPVHLPVGPDGGEAWELAMRASVPGDTEFAGYEVGDVSELIFTSGTEATPKAIMHTEQTANFSVRTAFADLGMTAADVVWMPSPVGHSTGFNYGIRMALYHGLPLVLQDRWNPAAAARLIAEHGCSYTLSAPTFLEDLVTTAERGGLRLPSLRLFGCGGAPVPPSLVDRAEAVGVGALRLYGSTEVLVATWNRPDSPASARRTTDGPALTDVEIEVRDDDGRRCEPGEPGEVFVRGPNTCVGLFDDPEGAAATFADGWVKSGDLAVQDADGLLTVVGRKKEIIIRGGMNIAPREIEDLLVAFPQVRQAAVVGMDDTRLGEVVCACVVLEAGAQLDLDGVRSRLRDLGVADYKIPAQLAVVEAIPMTASGKIQKHRLVAQLKDSAPGLLLRENLPLAAGGHATLLTLNSADSLNAIDWELLRRLDRELDVIAADPAVRVLLITGVGRAFSAGGDLKSYLTLQQDAVEFPRFVADLHRVFWRLRTLDVPVVALVNGVTAAGGLELMLNCDVCFAAETAEIRDGHQNVGQMGGGGVLTLLPRIIGIQRAAELIYTGRALRGAELVSTGLVAEVVPDAGLLERGLAFAEDVAAKSRLAIANAKQVMTSIWADGASVDAGLRFERERDVYYCLTSHDAPEGLAAFAEKRPPDFLGR